MGKRDKILFAAGLYAVVMLMIPGMILGEDAVITYHDQLDGEMMAYMLQAKHLFDGGTLPEFMNGAMKTALTPPAPACVLLFLGGNCLGAFWIMQLLGCITGYAGMYLLAVDVTGKRIPAVIAGILYAAIPFLPVYGLSQYGIPMLLWCALRLRKGENVIISFAYAAVFALNSSLVLVGVAMLAALAVMIVVDVFHTIRNGHTVKTGCLVRMWVIMLAGYIVTNLSLLSQVMGFGENVVSHKTEYVLAPESLWDGWINGLLYGGQHSQDYHACFMAATVVTVMSFYILLRRLGGIRMNGSFGTRSVADSGECERIVRIIFNIFGSNVCLSGAAAMWNSAPGVWLRDKMGVLGAFQMDRLLWLCPCLWYLMLACNIALIMEIWASSEECRKVDGTGRITRFSRICAGVCCLTTVAAVCVTGLGILKNSDFKSNIRKLFDSEYPVMSYSDYYAIGVMEQVEEYIRETRGLELPEYHVVSLGIDPAAALYHGFYCLDGYSNNYSLGYKHDFREIIAPALEVSDYLRDYYDDWGNRCYIFGSECPGYYTIEKNGFYFSHLELDAEALCGMGGNYLLSAAYIANAEDIGLTLLRDEPFQTGDSYYRIFIYEVTEPR